MAAYSECVTNHPVFTIGADDDLKDSNINDDECNGGNGTDDAVKKLPSIRVQDPLLHDSFSLGTFTSYKIIIETEHHAFHLKHSCIRRRFSDVWWLYETLHAHHKQVKIPPAPSKKIFSHRFESSFVQQRMVEIGTFLNELIQIEQVLSDTALHLFLQTDLTREEMDNYLNGTGDISDALIAEAWRNHGHVHTPNELGTFLSIATPKTIEMDEEDKMMLERHDGTPSPLDVAPIHAECFENMPEWKKHLLGEPGEGKMTLTSVEIHRQCGTGNGLAQCQEAGSDDSGLNMQSTSNAANGISQSRVFSALSPSSSSSSSPSPSSTSGKSSPMQGDDDSGVATSRSDLSR